VSFADAGHGSLGRAGRSTDLMHLRQAAARWADARDRAHEVDWDYRRALKNPSSSQARLDRLYERRAKARAEEFRLARKTNQFILRTWGRP